MLCSAEDLEHRQDLELPPDVMHDLQEEAIVMSRMRVSDATTRLHTWPSMWGRQQGRTGLFWGVLESPASRGELDGRMHMRCCCGEPVPAQQGAQLPTPALVPPLALPQHPNVIGFFGLCTLPPCILTGEHSR